MHLEEDMKNDASSGLVPYQNNPNGEYAPHYEAHLGKAFRVDNSENADWNCIRTPHSDALNLDKDWSVEAWVKISSLGTHKLEYPIIIDKGKSFGVWLDGNGKGFGSEIKFDNGTEVSFFQNQQLDIDKWYHIGVSSNSFNGTIYFYVHDENRNQVFADTRSFPEGSNGQVKHSENDLFIGGVDGNSNIQFDGWFDEIRITKKFVDFSAMSNSLSKTAMDFELSCFPNPIKSNSAIHLKLDKPQNITITVYDIKGRKLAVLFNSKLNPGKFTIPVANRLNSNGVYLIKVSSQRSSKTILVSIIDKH